MNLKDLFAKAENGVFTYDQLMAAANAANAKFVDLSEGKYVDKNKYDDDLNARDTRIHTLDEALAGRDTDLATLRQQLQEAGNDSAALEQVNTQLANLQTKYDTDTKNMAKQMQEQAYKFAVTRFADQRKFTSKAAKRDFIESMLAKQLQMDNDSIVGADDFVASYTKDNEDAFVKETTTPPPAANNPVFVTNTTSANDGGAANPFKFDFVGVRPHKE